MLSFKFMQLVLLEGLNMMNGSSVDANVVHRDDKLFIDTSISKYMSRVLLAVQLVRLQPMVQCEQGEGLCTRI